MRVRFKRRVVILVAAAMALVTAVTLTVAYFVGRNRLENRARLRAELTQKVLGQVPDFKIKDSIYEAFRTSERTVPVIRADITESATMLSRTFYYERQDVRTRVLADVSKVLVSPGDRVKAKQPLCILVNDSAESLLTQAKLDLDIQEARLAKLLTPASTIVSPQDLETLRLRVRQAEIAQELREIEAAKLTPSAPSTGKLVGYRVNAGDYVSVGQSLASLFDDSRILVVASVNQADISKIQVGTEASVAFGTNLPATNGRVVSVGMEGGVSGRSIVVPVSVEIDNPGGVYKSGMAANVGFRTDAEIPISAPGTCTPGARLEVKSMATGTVSALLAKEGATVTGGQPLVRIANRAIDLSVEQAKNDLAIARAALEKIESPQPVDNSDLLAQQLKVEQARYAVKQRQADSDSLQVLAPFDGVVSRVTVKPGDRVAAGTSVITVQNPQKLMVSVQIPEVYAPKISQGQQADVVFDYITDVPYVGKVVSIDSEGQPKDKASAFDAVIEITKPVSLRPGMTAKVTINTETRENVLAIPVRLVAQLGQDKAVTVLREDKKDFWRRLIQQTVVIQTGISDGVLIEVTCGLDQGEELIVPETK